MRSFKIAVIAVLISVFALSTAYGSGNAIFAETYSPGQIEEKWLYSGVVKENNPSLGYITLYFEDGSGADPEKLTELVTLRSFTYGYEITVLRDGYEANVDAIKPGDKVHIKLDQEGYIAKLSAKSFYKPIYGTVYSKRPTGIVLKKDNGSYGFYTLSDDVPVYRNNRSCRISDILAGDKIRIMVQTDGDSIDIEAIDIENISRPVTGIYRGNAESYDSMRYSLALSGVQQFINGRWENTSTIGIQRFEYSTEYRVAPPRRLSGVVYLATKKAYDGNDKIVLASFRGVSGYETIIKDNLLSITDTNTLEMEYSSELIGFDKFTIAVKDGRLIDVSALNTLDPIKASLEKSLYENKYTANVLVSDSNMLSGAIVYRGRISKVEPSKSITIESFAQLNGVSWSFTNTPKTFDIDLASGRFLEDDGIGNLRSIDSGFINRSVYIVAEGTKIKLISTAPYADSPAAGRVVSVGVVQGAEGAEEAAEEAAVNNVIKLNEARVYNNQTYLWTESPSLETTIPVNAIVIKRGTIGDVSLIKPGDEIRIVRHSQSNEGILVLCD